MALSIYQLPGSNALEIAAAGAATRWRSCKDRFPAGVDYAIVYDTTPFINESINEVFKTLRDAVILVALVVLVFLQNWRSAIIPLVAVPVAIIGTFAVMAAMGFSLNNLTLFGLVLAIGIVVDDAIVVVEAVEHHIEHGLSPRDADDHGHGAGLRPGDRRRPGAQRGVRALRVHHRHHRPVLPPVRPDDRRLDGHLRVQFADAQPGLGRAAAAAAARGVTATPLPRLAFVAGRRLAGLGIPDALVRDGAEQSPALRWPAPGRSGCAPGSAVAGGGWPAGSLPVGRSTALLGWLFRAVQHGLRLHRRAVYTGAVGMAAARQRAGAASSTAACCT